jgi:hypothetical protein
MTEQQDALEGLQEAGVLAGIRWAYLSATSRVLDDYSEAAGHDATWVGITRFNQFRDRLDRVFACGRYAVPAGSSSAVSLDVLHAELTERDIATMPRLAPDLVERADLNGSPGWAWQGWRWLLASCVFGKIDELPWSEKSPTKQRVARQPNPDPDQASLFDDLAEEEVAGLAVLLAASDQQYRQTLVVAHSQDVGHESGELVLGRARMNARRSEAWHWRHNLLSDPPSSSGSQIVDPLPTGPDPVPDAPVRLRRTEAQRDKGAGSGEA